jgi:hypothetical protein
MVDLPAFYEIQYTEEPTMNQPSMKLVETEQDMSFYDDGTAPTILGISTDLSAGTLSMLSENKTSIGHDSHLTNGSVNNQKVSETQKMNKNDRQQANLYTYFCKSVVGSEKGESE